MLEGVKKVRLDTLMVERKLAASRQQAQRLIMAGEVMIGSVRAEKPAQQVAPGVQVSVRARPPFVSRGGIKLEAAIARFELDVTGWICADVGASTGGFTDCLLQRGAAKVYAIDVGYGQLAWRLRQDPRVVVKERTNARYLAALPEPVDLVVVDVSFISLQIILERVLNWFGEDCSASNGQIIALVKPQFEAGRRQVGKGGVVRDPAVHRQVLNKMAHWAVGHGLRPAGLMPSPITGPAGNVEYLLHLVQVRPAAALTENEADLAIVSMGLETMGIETLVETCLASTRG
jgi:23S rRNA (cytidine1920-2'-O)/16S rRNA (cytidine1409-2'-O)-methyltransferase